MSKLSPEQFGRLAGYVKQSIELYPPENSEEISEKEASVTEDKMEVWEKWLKKMVNSDSFLPDYDSITFEVDWLIDYYEPIKFDCLC